MRLPSARSGVGRYAVLLALAWCHVGCNVFAAVQAGPVAALEPDGTRFCAEGQASAFLDVGAGAEWAEDRPPPETATRFGSTSSAYACATTRGFGMGVRPGLFVASTDAERLFPLRALSPAGERARSRVVA